MEASELGHGAKAESLAEYFKDSFLHFIITVHPADIPGESRGKGSNVSYAARVGCSEMIRRGVDRRRVILTISDSDSSIPELYVHEVCINSSFFFFFFFMLIVLHYQLDY